MSSLLTNKINQLLIGQVIRKRYQILDVLSSGTFTQSYLAKDILAVNSPQCVVKHYRQYPDSRHLSTTSMRLFLREAKYLHILGEHPQIPQLLDCFEDEENGLYLVKELIPGQLLSHYLPNSSNNQKPWQESQVWYLLYELLDVLGFMHQHGVMYGDLKPSNIIKRSSDNKLVLIDFANAQSLSSQKDGVNFSSLGAKIAVSASGYLAPEQLIGRANPSSDLYALGILAIQLLTGIVPTQLQLNLDTGELNWQQFLAPTLVQSQLVGIIDKMVRYHSSERYQSAHEVLEALKQVRISDQQPIIVFSEYQWPGLAKEKGSSHPQPLAIKIKWSEPQGALAWFELAQGMLTSYLGPTSPERESIATPELMTTAKPNQVELKQRFDFSKYLPVAAGVGVSVLFLNAWALSVGLNALLTSFSLDGGVNRLVKANQAYQQGKLDEAIALAESVGEDSPAYNDSQTAIQEWQQEWHQAQHQFQLIEQAFASQNWQQVVREAAKMPDIYFWQDKIMPLVESAKLSLEENAHYLLQQAFTQAVAKNFSEALGYLEKIPPESELGAKVSYKITEYREKREIRAKYYLQQAFNLAEQGDFLAAIEFLEKIPAQTETAAIAKAKIAEYKEKQELKTKAEQKTALKHLFQRQATNLVSLLIGTEQDNSEFNPGTQLQEINPQQISLLLKTNVNNNQA